MRGVPSLLLLGLVTTSVYLNSLDNAFQYDDEHSLTRNQSVRDMANIPHFSSTRGCSHAIQGARCTALSS